jgi:multidrug efflux pump subunit AcrA (membrane-fusion protein)
MVRSLVAFLVTVSLAGCAAELPADPSDDVPLRLHRGAVAPTLVLSGELEAERAVRVRAPNVGVWPLQLRWIVDDGAVVAEGDRLVELDTSELASRLEEARTREIEAANQLSATRARVAGELSESEYELAQQHARVRKARLAAEIPEGILAQREYDERQLELRRAELELESTEARAQAARRVGEADITSAELGLERARREVEQLTEQLSRLTISAPRDGIVVVSRDNREGRVFQVADNVYPGQPVVSIPDLATLTVVARLFDVDDGRVASGTPVVVTLDAYPRRSLEGVVRSVAGTAETASSRSERRWFRVVVDVEGLEAFDVRPGMSARVEARLTVHPSAVVASRAALRHDGEQWWLRLAGGEQVAVTVVVCDAHRCELSDTGGVKVGAQLESWYAAEAL